MNVEIKQDIRFGFSKSVYFPSKRNQKKQLKHCYQSEEAHLSSLFFFFVFF